VMRIHKKGKVLVQEPTKIQKTPKNTNGNSQVVFKSTWIFEPFCPTPLIWIFDVFDVGVVSASRSL